MADVFVSYKRENAGDVGRLVAALRETNLSVWWDQDIAPDAPWEATIERELASAKVVIVAWSEAAVASDNVKAEARRARTKGKLLQTFVEPCEPPLFFGERQGVDLSGWNGAASDNRFRSVLAAIRAIITGRRPPDGVGYAPRRRSPYAALVGMFVVMSAVLGFVANLGGARDAVCSLGAFTDSCRSVGLTGMDNSSADAIPPPTEARHRLLQSIAGTWGRQDRDCSEVVSYSVERRDNTDRIIASATNYRSVGQVIAAENGVVVSRDTSSQGGAREQWEFRPDGDRLVVYDKDGVATTLIRCE